MKELDKIKREIIETSQSYKPREIWLFGSLLEDFDKARDIDIGISGVDKDFFRLAGRLIGVLKKYGKKVDVIPLDWLWEKEVFMKEVRKGIRLYG
ncbi:MAG: hypothetical protein COT45_01745 [bacterium (Candidatus Stahlbacteria) CG08_land_8_20_14_0_20_40_26]|jgi:predicted nucleotidyltransferase|nr:nucleotidyltransferase domain-containing protein [candidate division WOR-3 bacterium]PIP11956.1 MAG: hypothetical protein COX49_08275 [bacterium (Candidatus Stahlbacteria) CG23_combo_of_CG06-09_8_20_14_all_40_9]PIS25857.1 MAG: hypothetical protein COT45_01745 [bacterium (Candidatus Stahlbacteria) CG08_land_8_20_14_0_20_40_26]